MTQSERQPFSCPETRPSDQLNHAFTGLVSSLQRKIDETGWLEQDIEFRDGINEVRNNEKIIKPPYHGFPGIYTLAPEMLKVVSTDLAALNPTTPIGEYQANWSRRLLIAGTKLIREIEKDYKPLTFKETSPISLLRESQDISRNYRITLGNYTHMAKSTCEDSDPLDSLVDSLHSTLNTAGFFTMYKVAGYENDPQRLLDDLVDQDVFSMLSLIIPPRVTGELGRFGGVFTKPTIEIQSNGKLGIRKDIVEHYIKERKSNMKNYSTNAGANKDLDRPGCPVGRRINGNPNSGVDMAAKIFADTVRAQKV